MQGGISFTFHKYFQVPNSSGDKKVEETFQFQQISSAFVFSYRYFIAKSCIFGKKNKIRLEKSLISFKNNNKQMNTKGVDFLTTSKMENNLLKFYWETIQKHPDSFFAVHLKQTMGLFKFL